MIKAVIFDLDGTLLDRDKSLKVFVSDQYERLGGSLTDIPKQEYIDRFIELDDHGYVWKDKVYKQLVEEFVIKGIGWEELLQDYLVHFKKHCIPFPELLETLQLLKKEGFLLGVVTNGKGQFQMDNLQALQINNYIDAILISEWEGVKKPDPLIFERASQRLSVNPGECVFIGDHPEKDVHAAQAAGMTGIWKKNGSEERIGENYVIEELDEIPGLLRNIYA